MALSDPIMTPEQIAQIKQRLQHKKELNMQNTSAPSALRRALETLSPADAREILAWIETSRNPITWISAVISVRAIKNMDTVRDAEFEDE